VSTDVIVVGAGWAGLAAAVDLARSGLGVRVLESSSIPGGRARSFMDRVTGETLDNGQHLMLGCYRETLDLVRTLGTHHLLTASREPIPLFLDGGERASIRSVKLPGPLHMLPSLADMRHLSVRDRLRMGRAAAVVALAGLGDARRLDSMSASDWLEGPAGQSARAMKMFWDPLVTAMLNEEPRRASATMLVVVLREGLLAGHEPSRPLLPTVGLGDLVARPAVRAIQDHGGDVLMRTRVRGIRTRGGQATAVCTSRGDMEADAFVLAVPSWRIAGILDGAGVSHAVLEADRLEPSPIVTVFLRYRRPILDEPVAGLLGGRFHWLFDRNDIEPGPPRGTWSYSAVASAATGLVDDTSRDIADAAAGEIATRIPAARRSLVVGARVVKDRRATFRPAPGTAALRPGPDASGLGNLFLAGDWTDTGLPATLEGAVISGRRCADLVRGRPSVRDRPSKCKTARIPHHPG